MSVRPSIVPIRISDQQAALDSYTEKLGMEKIMVDRMGPKVSEPATIERSRACNGIPSPPAPRGEMPKAEGGDPAMRPESHNRKAPLIAEGRL